MNKALRYAPLAALAMALLISPLWADQATKLTTRQAGVEEKVRHELLMLPFYTVFDNLEYQVLGDTVTLTGQVTRPTLRTDAEAAVRRLESVGRVVNQIEVLPLSSFDNHIRWAVWRALYNRNSALFRYGVGGLSAIHIVVDNGHVTLVGRVSSEMDKNLARIYAGAVPGIFSVTDKLTVG